LNDTSVYTTDNTEITAVLALHGIHPTAVEFLGRKWIYRFADSAYLREIIDAYSRGLLTGSLHTFMGIYKNIVSRMRREAMNATAESGR